MRNFICMLLLSACVAKAAEIAPGEPVDYAAMSFNPKEWPKRKLDPMMIPWSGSNVVFLTKRGEYDAKLMGRWVERLDGGWRVYADLTGRNPGVHKQLFGKPTIAAVPDGNVTCGVGCGFIGVGGIELAKFYNDDWPKLQKDPYSMPHYVFYEMGRNFYTFGDRHSCFITGFAVFMRYVCMDALACNDVEAGTRKVIEEVESHQAKGDTSFLKFFTNADGLTEKQPRLKKFGGPCDQPVTYASAMLRLRRECGGDTWVKRFFAELAACPESKRDTREGALAQCWNWYLCASVAARRDLAQIFCGEWKLPLADTTRAELKNVAWDAKDLSAANLAKQISPVWLP